MSGATTNPAFPPGSRSSDYGIWSREAGPHTYRALSKAFLYTDTAMFRAGSQVIEQAIEVTDAEHFKSDAVTRFYDTNGNLYRSVCASASAVRFH